MKALYSKSSESIIIATRITPDQYDYVNLHSGLNLDYHKEARIMHTILEPANIVQTKIPGKVAVMCAGTSDYSVAEEAAIMLELSGVEFVDRI